MDEPKSADVFALFTRPSHRRQPAPLRQPPDAAAADQAAADAPAVHAAPSEPPAYKATLPARSQREIRLRIHYPKWDKVRLFAYSHLNEVLVTGHQWLSLVFTHCVVMLKGRHLDTLVDDLQDDRLRALICFRPGHHQEPEEGEPCILEIHDTTLADLAYEKREEGSGNEAGNETDAEASA